MSLEREYSQGRWALYAVVALMVAVVSLLHYTTAVHIHQAHGIYRRLYYFPIILAAFLGGWRASLITAVCVCLAYIPHAFGLVGFDPAPTLEKILEMVLYVAIGILTGILVSREARTRLSLWATARGLRRALDEKAAMEAELVRSARLATVGRLSAGLAHEIRNPLASIQGAAEVLRDDFPVSHPKSRLLAVLLEEAGRLNSVLTRFLAFARPQTGRTERLDLAAEIAHVIELLRHREDLAGVEITGPAARTGRWWVSADREQIRQLLLNLLLNAAQAAGPRGRVTVAVQVDSGSLICRIDDDGPGFTAEALENFGTPFYTTKPGGTGLGLAICHRIVENLSGAVGAENLPERGARVTIKLPQAEVESDGPNPGDRR